MLLTLQLYKVATCNMAGIILNEVGIGDKIMHHTVPPDAARHLVDLGVVSVLIVLDDTGAPSRTDLHLDIFTTDRSLLYCSIWHVGLKSLFIIWSLIDFFNIQINTDTIPLLILRRPSRSLLHINIHITIKVKAVLTISHRVIKMRYSTFGNFVSLDAVIASVFFIKHFQTLIVRLIRVSVSFCTCDTFFNCLLKNKKYSSHNCYCWSLDTTESIP